MAEDHFQTPPGYKFEHARNLPATFFLLKKMPAPQAKYYILTIPHHDFVPWLPPGVAYIRGQLELSHQTQYLHWQLLAVFERKLTLTAAKRSFSVSSYLEPSRSAAADEYVWKEDTRVEGTQFELGVKPFKRNSAADWQAVLDNAKRGRVDGIAQLKPFLRWLNPWYV